MAHMALFWSETCGGCESQKATTCLWMMHVSGVWLSPNHCVEALCGSHGLALGQMFFFLVRLVNEVC